MTKRILATSLCAFALASVAPILPAKAAEVRVNVNTRTPTIYFDTEPDVVVIPNSRVYYYQAPEYDVYRYGRGWYVNRDGYWYRASSYRGPFVRVSAGAIPRQIVVVPTEYRRYPMSHDQGKHKGWSKRRY